MSISSIKLTSLAKLPTYLLLAILLNIAIFILIQKLVSKEIEFNRIADSINLVDFIRLEQQAQPEQQQQEQEQPEPPEPEDEPPPPETPKPSVDKPAPTQMDLPMPSLDIPLSLSGTPYLGDFAKNTRAPTVKPRPARPAVDTNVKPTLRVPPVYPPRALRSGIEGVVTVEFTIAVDGSVKDAEVIKAKPGKIFNKAVLNAISKWKFNPDMVDGKPVEKRARQDIKFSLQR